MATALKSDVRYDFCSLFAHEILKSFRFLETELGLTLKEVTTLGYLKIIRYESPIVYLNIIFGPPSFEIEISFGRIGIDDARGGYSFNRGDLMLQHRCRHLQCHSFFPDFLLETISEDARWLRDCGNECLKGDTASYDEMRLRRSMLLTAFNGEEKIELSQNAVDATWHRFDWNAVVNLYHQMVDKLTQVRSKA